MLLNRKEVYYTENYIGKKCTPNLTVHRNPTRKPMKLKSKPKREIAVIISCLGFALLALIFVQVAQINQRYELAALLEAHSAYLEEKAQLTLEHALLTRPERIIKIAETKLGMVKTSQKNIWNPKATKK